MIQFNGMKVKYCKSWKGPSLLGQAVFIYDVRNDMWKGLMICNGWVDYLEARTLNSIEDEFGRMVNRRVCEV